MKTTLPVMLAAVAFAAVGCASQTDETDERDARDARDGANVPADDGSDEVTGRRADALRNTGGGLPDRDTCEAWKVGCYTSCQKSNDSSCYRFCDIQYAQCRGLPPPELAIF